MRINFFKSMKTYTFIRSLDKIWFVRPIFKQIGWYYLHLLPKKLYLPGVVCLSKQIVTHLKSCLYTIGNMVLHACSVTMNACNAMIHACNTTMHACNTTMHAYHATMYACKAMMHAYHTTMHVCNKALHACTKFPNKNKSLIINRLKANIRIGRLKFVALRADQIRTSAQQMTIASNITGRLWPIPLNHQTSREVTSSQPAYRRLTGCKGVPNLWPLHLKQFRPLSVTELTQGC